MIESIKNNLWYLLKEKRVSLVMIYNREGKILWHRGRKIQGKTIADGHGFCRSIIRRSMDNGIEIHRENEYIAFAGEDISESADRLLIKHIIIQPVEEFFLYIDSGDKIAFTDVELGIFKTLGNLLAHFIRQIKKQETDLGGISGTSPAMKKVKELVLKYSLEEDCILLLGETGVGKSHVAELIHKYSGCLGQFVVADTTTINENLFESEIFGHIRGAFTGAITNKKGLIDQAENGTLFLDEIAEVPVSFQAKLLRLIETKKYRVLGNPEENIANVRIIAATNRDLNQMIKDKQFREDLFYRLNILTIEIPPLRERKNDIAIIIEENKRYLKGKKIGDDFLETITSYDWPGNFRELFSVLKRAGILFDSPITGKQIDELIQKNTSLDEALKSKNKINALWAQIGAGETFWDVVKKPFLARDLNREEAREIVRKALAKSGGRYVDSLEILNINKNDYNRLIKFLHKNRLN